MDGKNVWESIAFDVDSPRTTILHNIDPSFDGAAVRQGDWKLIHSNLGRFFPNIIMSDEFFRPFRIRSYLG